MHLRCRVGWLLQAAVAISPLLLAPPAFAQNLAAGIDLSGAVQVDEIDGATRTHLERAAAYATEQQWDEAVETFRQVMETQGARLVRLESGRYLAARDYCHLQITRLATEGLTLYRQRVDAVAGRWYQEALKSRDVLLLRRVVRELFASSWGDEALFALGELELEQGAYGRARDCWERLSPQLKNPAGGPLWVELKGADLEAVWPEWSKRLAAAEQPAEWLAYPDTNLNLAEIRARLVLVSILEGARQRAEVELAIFNRLHKGAKGRLGGREVELGPALAAYLTAAAEWPARTSAADWPTFGGAPERSKIAPAAIDIAGPAWEAPIRLGPALQADTMIARHFRLPPARVGEKYDALLSYHPVVARGLLLINTQSKIGAYDVRSGKPAWTAPWIYSDDAEPFDSTGARLGLLGVPRYTMTVYGSKLYARMGAPVTGRAGAESLGPVDSSFLVCLDLEAEGRLMWKISPPDDRWSFEGSPLCDGENVYAVMRHSDVRPEVHVACFDAQTEKLRWRRLICAAESLSRGQVDEATNNLLTLHDGALYVNTNLGAVAALDTAEGDIRWLATYARAKPSDPALHFYRDLNPCVYDRGSLFLAPTDTSSLLGFDAATGALLWESPLAEDVVHLLGVGAGNLIASGNRLWWLNADSGKVVYFEAGPKGQGRGVLAGDEVYWPTADCRIMIYSQAITPGQGPQTRQPIDLVQHVPQGTPPPKPGNLLPAGNSLLIVGPDQIVAFAPTSLPPAVSTDKSAMNGPGD